MFGHDDVLVDTRIDDARTQIVGFIRDHPGQIAKDGRRVVVIGKGFGNGASISVVDVKDTGTGSINQVLCLMREGSFEPAPTEPYVKTLATSCISNRF